MSNDEAIKLALLRRSFWYKRKMVKNINNGLGIAMMEQVMKDAGYIFTWSQYYHKKWEGQTMKPHQPTKESTNE